MQTERFVYDKYNRCYVNTPAIWEACCVTSGGLTNWLDRQKMQIYDREFNKLTTGAVVAPDHYVTLRDASNLVANHANIFEASFVDEIKRLKASPTKSHDKEVPASKWAMYEVDASSVTPEIGFTKYCTLARTPQGAKDEFEVDFLNKRVRVPRAAVHKSRPYDIGQTYAVGEHVEVFVLFKDVSVWTQAYVIEACDDQLNYKVLLVQTFPGAKLGPRPMGYSRMRKIK